MMMVINYDYKYKYKYKRYEASAATTKTVLYPVRQLRTHRPKSAFRCYEVTVLEQRLFFQTCSLDIRLLVLQNLHIRSSVRYGII